ncbi:MAG TPA: NAD-dependent epimerase/dehydratase family protein [Acidimicrobiales bacterium]|nr:NAD-dependent epimerase/dehydratase family protein [Acidimicrobiales bacterium]
MDVLITGGNGFVGRYLVRALLSRGDRVRVLALPTEDTAWLSEQGVVVHRGDIRLADSVSPAAHGADAVVHLAAMMDVWRPFHDYWDVNVAGTEHVARAALSAGARRFVHMSSSSVYGVAPGAPVDESRPLAPFDDPYPRTKAEADVLVQRMFADEGLPAVIIRPDQIFGPGDVMHFGKTAERLLARRSIVAGRGDNALPLVYVTDAVRGLLLALDDDRAVGQAFNITNDDVVTQRAFLETAAAALGAPRPRAHVPYRLLYAAAWSAEHVARRTGRRPALTRLGVVFAATDMRFSIEKARRVVGYAPEMPLTDGVRLAAEWFQGRGPRVPVPEPAT